MKQWVFTVAATVVLFASASRTAQAQQIGLDFNYMGNNYPYQAIQNTIGPGPFSPFAGVSMGGGGAIVPGGAFGVYGPMGPYGYFPALGMGPISWNPYAHDTDMWTYGAVALRGIDPNRFAAAFQGGVTQYLPNGVVIQQEGTSQDAQDLVAAAMGAQPASVIQTEHLAPRLPDITKIYDQRRYFNQYNRFFFPQPQQPPYMPINRPDGPPTHIDPPAPAPGPIVNSLPVNPAGLPTSVTPSVPTTPTTAVPFPFSPAAGVGFADPST